MTLGWVRWFLRGFGTWNWVAIVPSTWTVPVQRGSYDFGFHDLPVCLVYNAGNSEVPVLSPHICDLSKIHAFSTKVRQMHRVLG